MDCCYLPYLNRCGKAGTFLNQREEQCFRRIDLIILRDVMYKDKKIVVAMPAYNAAKTLQETSGEMVNQGIVDLVVIVCDASRMIRLR